MTGPTVVDITNILAGHVQVPRLDLVHCTCGAGPWPIAGGNAHRQHLAELITPIFDRAEVDAAIDTIARHVIDYLVYIHIGDRHEDYPDIGQRDWDLVVARVEHLTTAPPRRKYEASYDLLAARAGGS